MLKVTYSEGYEQEPRDYPFFRVKGNRLDAEHGRLIGPHDEVRLDVVARTTMCYEPFWFRTFRLLRLQVCVDEPGAVTLQSLAAVQTNYPLEVQAS
ncbi:bacterial alpha-l-rhamnosidase domain containing protein [Grosmannia clavigera kw1407]|uniref:Bacterial alpha-l-rhamnosidase domain containing protein n=1 Tax=Grosmannia clavigera (strain kw1407 / UAMH 11150) TaxID=655863 RepID=F0XP41_GROCL|nr:bacterial alpha-l-rhamnosidase domain containing protein [Grosmannia clavigera kw1407]EFX00283.1 bacterial alpha-l-rhamnosidase domain containing protein [Grosmannia clavigera kw1407]